MDNGVLSDEFTPSLGDMSRSCQMCPLQADSLDNSMATSITSKRPHGRTVLWVGVGVGVGVCVGVGVGVGTD